MRIESINAAITRFISKDMRPFETVEGAGFIELL